MLVLVTIMFHFKVQILHFESVIKARLILAFYNCQFIFETEEYTFFNSFYILIVKIKYINFSIFNLHTLFYTIGYFRYLYFLFQNVHDSQSSYNILLILYKAYSTHIELMIFLFLFFLLLFLLK